MSQFQVDVTALRAFRDAVRGRIIGNSPDAIGGLTNDTMLQLYFRAVGPPQPDGALSFGEVYTDFGRAADLSELFGGRYRGWMANYRALLDALEMLAGVADRLAANYENAAGYDEISAKTVDDAFDSVVATGTPPTATPAGTPPAPNPTGLS